MSGWEQVAVIVMTMFGSIVQGATGIGLTLVAGPALLAIDADFAPAPLLIVGQLIGVRHIIAEHSHLDTSAFRRLLFGLPLGIIGAVVVLVIVDKQSIAAVVAALVCVAAGLLLAGFHPRRTPRRDSAAGAATAFAGVTAGLPGPSLAIAFHDMTGGAMRATTSYFVAVVGGVGVVVLLLVGELGGQELALVARMLPGLILGLFLARWVRPWLDHTWFRPAILTIALAGGLAVLVGHFARSLS